MRRLSSAAAVLLVLALAGCVPTQFYAGGVEKALREESAVGDLRVTTKDNQINSPARIDVDVTLKPASTPNEVGDVVDAWYSSTPDGMASSLQLVYPGSEMYGAILTRNTNAGAELRAAAVEWSTLALAYPGATASFSSSSDSGLGVVLPQADSPSAVRAAIDDLRSVVFDAETGMRWWIRSTDVNGADQGLEVTTDGGLPNEQSVVFIESMDAAFQSATSLGEVYVTVSLDQQGTSVDVDFSPEQFANTPGSQVPEQLVDSSVWPAMKEFVDASAGGAERLTIEVFGYPMAVLSTSSCERPADERFPLDFEVWDYRASVGAACVQ